MTAGPTAHDRLARVMARWRVTLEERYEDVHPGNLVSRCTLQDGTPAVIKTEPLRTGADEFGPGVDALLLYGGRWMVRVLDVDREEQAVLMERVLPGETLWHEPIATALDAAAAVLKQIRQTAPEGHRFSNVRTYHRAWPNHLRLYGGAGPIDADLFEIGERVFLELCDTSAAPVVLHGDLHYGNVLRSDRSGWLAIDPKGVLGEPCYDVGDLFRNRVRELHDAVDPIAAMRWRVEAVADLTGFDRERVRLWSFAQAVLSELWTADQPHRAADVDLEAARLLHEIGPLG